MTGASAPRHGCAWQVEWVDVLCGELETVFRKQPAFAPPRFRKAGGPSLNKPRDDAGARANAVAGAGAGAGVTGSSQQQAASLGGKRPSSQQAALKSLLDSIVAY